ncbi:TetR/AcrR family transcriptional regulator [Serratia odorifera]|uniref:Bacterial regulatory proteins, tetR family n=1 Tax=Serratia odorifera TaxID=618 RepID=A0A447KRD4_SEROD|nr:TetR family transcriptional regulator [Serratia odorifera]PNK90930.1 TetR family transcriptional regulator [Serratia odorifera]RII72249.1 TetR family transcriptional regulator [Serratia odorifera]VDZ57531.1 Bacterial regulatory proteins, tetR family [Serratia odorifera]
MSKQPVLRVDAQQNRERILAAADALFLERGAGASLEEVARRAGVGIGTLYRRFATREELLAATYNARLLTLAEASRARDAEHDPVSALRAYLEGLVINTTRYRGLALSLDTVLQSGTPGCDATTEEGQRLLHCGQQAGIIRPDVTFDDLVFVVTASSLAAEQDEALAARVSHLVDLFLNGISVR